MRQSMSEETTSEILVKSSRFGEFEVPADSIIELPSGLIGFPKHRRFVMIDHKPPFSWLHCVDDADLAFVVVDGFEFGEKYKLKPPPFGDVDIDLKPDDEFAILVIVTVRSDPKDTTANLKAPLFVNVRTRKGVQVIFDDPNLSTRTPLLHESLVEATESESKDKK
jgi:flagellar assembly factor FliW